MQAQRNLVDPFNVALIGTLLLATLLPCDGEVARAFEWVTVIGIAVLFFLHGARLSREAIIAGIVHWRLHLIVLATTFVIFPLIGFGLKPVAGFLLTPDLYIGVLFLCALPSTVQSSIAFTSIARGNVPAAVCSASLSNLLGVFLTPLLVSLLLSSGHNDTMPLDSIGKISMQLFAPFVLGHLMRPLLGSWVTRHHKVLSYTDRGTVLLVVYVAFSASIVEGLWKHVPPIALAGLFAVAVLILSVVLLLTTWMSRRLGFSREDEIAIVFCGSKKSLASGVPIANILFAGNPALGMILLPIMLFHQIQLIACAMLAQRYARRVT
jgi:sodium/bile acid cotransporter 7